jgi:hypothetical protein
VCVCVGGAQDIAYDAARGCFVLTWTVRATCRLPRVVYPNSAHARRLDIVLSEFTPEGLVQDPTVTFVKSTVRKRADAAGEKVETGRTHMVTVPITGHDAASRKWRLRVGARVCDTPNRL